MDFVSRLKKAMNLRGMSPIELSEATGIAKGTISKYINRKFKPKYEKKIILAKALKISPAYLLGITNDDEMTTLVSKVGYDVLDGEKRLLLEEIILLLEKFNKDQLKTIKKFVQVYAEDPK